MKKYSVVLSAVLLVLLGGLLGWIVFFTEGLVASGETVEWAQFLGRFHPVILHLPIGLFVGLVVLELFALRKQGGPLDHATHVLVWLMALTSLLSVYFGLLLASNGDYGGDTLWWHKWLGVIFAAVSLVLVYYKVLSLQSAPRGLKPYRLLLLGLMVLMPVVGHFGGHLTHGAGYLTQYASEWMKAIVAPSELAVSDSESEVDRSVEGNQYTQQIQPLFEQYCIQCHGPEKQKSRYRLDTYEHLMTPGSMGDTPIEPYSISQSSLLEYMLLPEDDDMAMPPEGKPRPSADELLMFTHWVANGAVGPPVDAAALAAEEAAKQAALEALAAERAQFETLFEAGLILLPVGQDSELLYLDFQNVDGELSTETLQLLAPFRDRIYEIKLTGMDHTVAPLELLSGAAELRVLNISGLQDLDAAVSLLNGFVALEELNVFGSDLSDAGLAQLSLPELNTLYLGSTSVSPAQQAIFLQENPTIKVYGDVDLDAVESIKTTDLSNTAEFNPNDKK